MAAVQLRGYVVPNSFPLPRSAARRTIGEVSKSEANQLAAKIDHPPDAAQAEHA